MAVTMVTRRFPCERRRKSIENLNPGNLTGDSFNSILMVKYRSNKYKYIYSSDPSEQITQIKRSKQDPTTYMCSPMGSNNTSGVITIESLKNIRDSTQMN